MTRYEAVLLLEAKFLSGFWLTRQQIMLLTGYNADVTHLVRGVRERGVPVTSIPSKPPCKTIWGVTLKDLKKHETNPHKFRSENLNYLQAKHEVSDMKQVRRIYKEHGALIIIQNMGK